MSTTQEATKSNEENFPILVSGTRGREFKSHRPDHSICLENIGENDAFANSQGRGAEGETKHSQNISGGFDVESDRNVKFPKRLRHRGKGKVLATIYRLPSGYPSLAHITPPQLDAFAATRGPGLPNALMTGFKAAQAMSFASKRPFVAIHHHEAHLYSPWIVGDPPRADFGSLVPNVSLIVSGGHTMLVHVRGEFGHIVLGSTLDDAAGECFDKTAKLIGLPYPGGPKERSRRLSTKR
jgi:hypothetical protein